MRRPDMQTGRLSLRPVRPADGAAVVAALGDWQVVRWLAVVPFPYTPDDFRRFLDTARPGATWVIADAGGLAGIVSLDGALGYWLARSAWGRGYATEACRAVIAAHFADPGAAPIRASWHEGNDRSARVLGKLGFVTDGFALNRTAARPETATLSCRMRLDRGGWLAAARA